MFINELLMDDACSLCVFCVPVLPLGRVNTIVKHIWVSPNQNLIFLMQLAGDPKCSGNSRCINGNTWCRGSTETRGSSFFLLSFQKGYETTSIGQFYSYLGQVILALSSLKKIREITSYLEEKWKKLSACIQKNGQDLISKNFLPKPYINCYMCGF